MEKLVDLEKRFDELNAKLLNVEISEEFVEISKQLIERTEVHKKISKIK